MYNGTIYVVGKAFHFHLDSVGAIILTTNLVHPHLFLTQTFVT